MKTPSPEASGVRVLHKTLDILEEIKSVDGGYKLADLARKMDLPKATVYRILATLEGRGYLDRAPDGGYRVARKLFELQRSQPFEQVLQTVARPVMERLVAWCKETVNLGILDAGEVVVINTVESPMTVRMSSKIGNRRHFHATALGKVMLAAMPEKEVHRLVKLKGLPRLTSTTITTRSALEAELQTVRRQGWALDDQENEIGGRCISAAIEGPGGRVAAALSISGPEFRMDLARAKSMVKELKAACAEISALAAGA